MCAAEGNLRGLQYEELGCVLGHAGTFASCRARGALGRKLQQGENTGRHGGGDGIDLSPIFTQY